MTQKKLLPPAAKSLQSSYIRYDAASGMAEHVDGVQGGETCHVPELKDIFAWMRGYLVAWYGYANDGKGTFLDFMQMLDMKYTNCKVCTYRQEDMDTAMIDNPDGKTQHPEIRANRIYKNMAWIYSGKTWNKDFALRNKCSRMTMQEEMEAIKFVTDRYFVIYPKDRHYKNIRDDFKWMNDKYGPIKHFNIDPFNTVKLDDISRGDERLVDAFMAYKDFAMEENAIVNFVNHPKTTGMMLKVSKAKDAPYKYVTSDMQLGGTGWNMKMDMEMSVFRHERHLDFRSPKVTLFNLKQRQGEVVGVDKGEYDKIEFDRIKKHYYFEGTDPMDGAMKDWKQKLYDNANKLQQTVFAEEQPKPAGKFDDDMPF